MTTLYMIVFATIEDGEVSAHGRLVSAGSDADLERAESALRTAHAPVHLRSIQVADRPFQPAAELARDEDRGR